MGIIKSFFKQVQDVIKLPFLISISLYQMLISPVLGPRCKFHPSCSEYALGAIKIHGVLLGIWLSINRLIKCHPGSKGGIEDVPETAQLWKKVES